MNTNLMLTDRIIDYMEKNRYQIFRGEKELNIVYVEGMNPDGSLNDDAPNQFNDVRMVIGFESDEPLALGIWEGTTEPGRRYTIKPMNKNGAARVAFGQYRAWSIGRHGNSESHEALIQVHPVKVHRDYNKDFIRTGDRIEEGLFGINQHYGYDLPRSDIGLASAGCLVGRSRAGQNAIDRNPEPASNA